MAFAVVRIRSPRKKQKKIEDTLEMLRLYKVNHCTIVPEDPNHEGMLNKVKDLVTWGEVEEDVLVDLLKHRSDLEKEEIEEKIKEQSSYDDIEGFAEAVVQNEVTLGEIEGLENIFRMHPPKGGYEGVKKPYNTGGSLGYRSDDVNSLIKSMLGPEYLEEA